MPKTYYALRKAGPLASPDLDAQAIGERLEELIDEKKEHVTHEEIIADARHANSPMNPAFTWNENEAADKWRKRQARNLTKALVIKKGTEATHTRAFVYVHHPEHEGMKVLMTTRSAMANPDMREQVVEQAIHALRRSLSFWATRYGGNPQLKALAKDVKALHARVERELMAVV